MKKHEVLGVILGMVEFLYFAVTNILNVENTFLRISLAIVIVCVSVSLLVLSLSYLKSRDIPK